MGCTTQVKTSDCFYDKWKMCRGVYWARKGGDNTRSKIVMSYTGGSCPSDGEVRTIRRGESAVFGNGAYVCKIIMSGERWANIEVWKKKELEPDMTKPQIISNHSDKLGYTVGDIIKSQCIVRNIGASGTVHLTVGLGYIDSSNMIFLTGMPTTDQLYLNYQQYHTFKEDVKVDITDYYRQQGIGWAYLKQQMYLFFLVGHKVSGDIIWDTERHIKIYLEPKSDFVDPTSLPEVLPDIIPGAIPGIGDILPDGGDIIDWAIDKTIPKPKEEDEFDIMPFIYIGFMGLIGYMLMRSK